MSTRFFTNFSDNTLLNKFREIFEINKDIANFDALVRLGQAEIHLVPISAV